MVLKIKFFFIGLTYNKNYKRFTEEVGPYLFYFLFQFKTPSVKNGKYELR